MQPLASFPGTTGLSLSDSLSTSDEFGAPGKLFALRSLLWSAPLLVEQGDPNLILHLVATAVPTLTRCRTDGIMFESQWYEVAPDYTNNRFRLQDLVVVLDPIVGAPGSGPDGRWTCAFPLANGSQASGYLVVSADLAPSDHEQFLLRSLAHQAGVALANAILHARERDEAEGLRVEVSALERSVASQQRLTRVAAERQGEQEQPTPRTT